MKQVISILTVTIFLAVFQGSAYSQFSQEQLNSITPGDALSKLKEGNKRFISMKTTDRDWSAEIEESSIGQYPYAVILNCMDSRVPIEIIFDQGIGYVFNNRVAGNIVNDDIMGSMEYGCAVVGSKLILVLGHTECGAVKGAIDDVELGNLTGLLDKIKPAIASTEFVGNRTSSDEEFVELVTEENVRLAMEEIRNNSPTLKGLEDEGKIMIVGGLYDVSTGEVIFYE